MSNCTFKYIENQFRQTDPEKADYFNNLSLDTWAELKDSKLFKEKTKEDKKYLYVNNPNTKKRQSQDALINGINAKLGASIVNISNENFITVNTSPLFNIFTEDKFFINYNKKEVEKNIKDNLPKEIANSIEVLDVVPQEVLGRNDLYLSMKDIFKEKGITNAFLVNWFGITLSSNLSRNQTIKSVTSETQIEKMAKDSYSKLLKLNDPILKNKDIKESFDKWVKALENYPIVFKDLMLKHAIKHLRNPERRSKFVLQLSSVALQQTYGIAVNKPHELNRIGKLYDSEVLKTVSDAVGHEPSASGKGYWVHVPRTDNPQILQKLEEKIKNLEGKLKRNSVANHPFLRNKPSSEFEKQPDGLYQEIDWDLGGITQGKKYTLKELQVPIQDELNQAKKELQQLNNTDNFKPNVELLRKLSPSTWCTASGMASHYVENYDNYLLIVDGVTVVGIEAKPDKTVKEVTSRGNNGVASIDHLDDTIAFFKKHNLDLNNRTIQNAIAARDKGKTDSEIFQNTEDLIEQVFDEEAYWAERNAIDRFNGEYEIDPPDYGFDDFDIEDYERERNTIFEEVQNVNTVQEAINVISNIEFSFEEVLRGLKTELINNEEVANKLIEKNSHFINLIDTTLPFYKELAHKAVIQNNAVYEYISEEAKQEQRNIDLHNAYLEKVIKEIDDLPFSKTNTNQIQGYYDAKNDKVVVIASNTPINEAAKVGIHEVAHRGILRMAKDLGGEKELFQVLKNAEKQLIEKLPELLKRTGHTSLENLMLDYGFNKNSEEGKFKLLSELAARWAETLINKPKPSWWKELLQSIKNWIKQFTGQILNEKQVDELVGGFIKYGTKNNNLNQKVPILNIPSEDKFFIEYIKQEAEKNNVDLTKDNCK